MSPRQGGVIEHEAVFQGTPESDLARRDVKDAPVERPPLAEQSDRIYWVMGVRGAGEGKSSTSRHGPADDTR